MPMARLPRIRGVCVLHAMPSRGGPADLTGEIPEDIITEWAEVGRHVFCALCPYPAPVVKPSACRQGSGQLPPAPCGQ
eukprot:7068501-Pyramimonas_sp.AAC.1